MKAFWNRITLWKLSWFRCVLYACVIGWTEFDSLTEGWTQADWDHQGKFTITKLLGKVIFGSMMMVIVAFLDQTITKARDSKNDDFPPIPTGQTEFLKNTQIPQQNENKTSPPTIATNP